MSDVESILPHIPAALLVVFRIGGLMIYGPVFGSSVVPVRVKVLLAFIVGIACYPVLAAGATAAAPATLDLWMLGPLVAMEIAIGLLIGYVASIPMHTAQIGGLIMGQQMGLGFARLYNPALEDEADVLGQMLFFLILAGFLVIGGHEAMLLAVLHSFEHIPSGAFVMDGDVIALLNGLLLASLEVALRVAAPVLALIFVENVALGYVSKTVPQLNILSLGFPLRILLGVLIVALGLTVISEVMMDGIDFVLEGLFEWIESR